MPATNNHLQTLFEKYMNNTCTREEWEELLQLVREEHPEAEFQQAFKSYWNGIDIAQKDTDYWNNRFHEMLEEAKKLQPEVRKETPVVPLYRRSAFKWIAAAAMILIIATTAIVISKRSEKSPATEVATTNDVQAPKETRAVITLADGSKVYLDSANNGTLAQQGNTNVIKTEDGKILYNANGQQLTANSPVYNTLTNPRGSKVIDMQLSDGSHVWLNAGSSVKYPVVFVGNERKVEITGEAYFEVVHNASMPFFVSRGDVSVQVLGTHFNVNAYDDEDGVKVTLLEGSVNVTNNAGSVKIKPGQQAVVNQVNPKISRIEVQTNVDTDAVMAWKNGQFNLQSTDLAMLMRQVARWYDVDIEFKGAIPQNKFGGSLNRDLNLSTLLKALQQSGINAQLEGRKIIVKE
jgi:transmembrane sensor